MLAAGGERGPALCGFVRSALEAAGLRAVYESPDEGLSASLREADGLVLAGPLPPERLAALLLPIGPAVRFRACRDWPGKPSNREGNLDIILLGDGGLGPPSESERDRLVEAAWGYAARHDRERITLALGAGQDAAELEDRLRGGAPPECEIALETVPLARLIGERDGLADRRADVIVAAGEGAEELFARASALAGGADRVPEARFGAEVAAILLADPGPAAASGGRIAAAAGAALLCAWLGETGRGARIEQAIARAAGDAAQAADVFDLIARN